MGLNPLVNEWVDKKSGLHELFGYKRQVAIVVECIYEHIYNKYVLLMMNGCQRENLIVHKIWSYIIGTLTYLKWWVYPDVNSNFFIL